MSTFSYLNYFALVIEFFLFVGWFSDYSFMYSASLSAALTYIFNFDFTKGLTSIKDSPNEIRTMVEILIMGINEYYEWQFGFYIVIIERFYTFMIFAFPYIKMLYYIVMSGNLWLFFNLFSGNLTQNKGESRRVSKKRKVYYDD